MRELGIVVGVLLLLLVIIGLIFSNPVVRDIIETRNAIRIQEAAAAREAKMPLKAVLQLHNIQPPDQTEEKEQGAQPIQPWTASEGS